MKKMKGKTIVIYSLITLINVFLAYSATQSVISTQKNNGEITLSQNIDNILTLTNTTSSKVEAIIEVLKTNVNSVSKYVNSYNEGNGMTENEIREYFTKMYDLSYNWQVISKEQNEDNEYIGKVVNYNSDRVVYYCTENNEMVYDILSKADETTIGKINITNRFEDWNSHEAAFALTTTIKVYCKDEVTNEYYTDYRTLMQVICNSSIDALTGDSTDKIGSGTVYNEYMDAIIDENGNFIITNKAIGPGNIFNYIMYYDYNFTDDNKLELLDEMNSNDFNHTYFYASAYKKSNCLYTITKINNTSWYVVSITPVDSFVKTNNISYFSWFFFSLSSMFLLDLFFCIYLIRKTKQKSIEAENANNAKSRFLSSMSHDIRTPMNAIIGMTTIANRFLDHDTVDKNAVKDCLKKINFASSHLLTLINDILDISKVESGKFTLNPQVFSLARTFENLINILHPQIKEKDLKLNVYIDNMKYEYVDADELRLNQIFINIFSNAIKYTPNKGTIEINIWEEKSPKSDKFIRLNYQVKDSGVGMKKEFIDHIFEPFSREKDIRIDKIQGSGLGMTITKQMVDLFEGKIDVESEVGVGSTFTVTIDLPLVEKTFDERCFENMNALVIDSDEKTAKNTKKTLESLGMITDIAYNFEESVNLADYMKNNGKMYTIIFVEWKMKDCDGLKLVSKLREIVGKDVPIVLTTVYDYSEIEEEAVIDGVSAFLPKPLFKSMLIHRITASLDTSVTEVKEKELDLSNVNILVAEDNDLNWEIISELLSFYGITTERAENGKVCVEMLQNAEKDKYKLILMDIQMPEMNGLEATQAIRNLSDYDKASIPIFAMTADAFADDVERCKQQGMNGHISKPVDIDKVMRIIKEVNDIK